MLVKVKTYCENPRDAESLWINPDQCAILKHHPSERKPVAGYICLACGKEFFVQLSDFHKLIKDHNADTSQPQKDNRTESTSR